MQQTVVMLGIRKHIPLKLIDCYSIQGCAVLLTAPNVQVSSCRGSIHEGSGGEVPAHRAKGAHVGNAGGTASGRHECAIMLEP